MVRQGAKAPSGHNTQPWRFHFDADALVISPDFDRSLPVADPAHRELYISLGCAAENVILTAGKLGYAPTLETETDHRGTTIRIQVTPAPEVTPSELYLQINRRQCTRTPYHAEPVPSSIIESLRAAVTEQGTSVRFFAGEKGIGLLEPCVLQAAKMQFADRSFRRELSAWMRFSQREAMHTGDGLWVACSGLPEMGRLMGSLIIRYMATSAGEAKRCSKLLAATPTLALLMADKEDPVHCIKLGRSFQRFGLTATAAGLRHAHLNAACQVPAVRDQMCQMLELEGQIPMLLIRLGYGEPMPVSFRRRMVPE